MRVEIIGGMGVGKTTLCKALHRSGLHCVYEQPKNNPYLELSYKSPKQFGFYSQLALITANFYTVSRYSNREGITFLDFSTITDRAYASMFLRGRAKELALETINYFEQKEGTADLYLHLNCSQENQIRRIRGRKRTHERRVGPKFLTRLNSHIENFVTLAERRGARILTVDTDSVNLKNDRDFIPELTKRIRQDLQRPHTWIRHQPANSQNMDQTHIARLIETGRAA